MDPAMEQKLCYAAAAIAVLIVIILIWKWKSGESFVAPMATRGSAIYGVIPRATIFNPPVRTQ